LRMIERGNKFQTLVLGNCELPDYIRVGKFMSKVKVNVLPELEITLLPSGYYQSQAYFLSVADLPPTLELLSFDLISMPPAPLLKNLSFRGAAWQIGEMIVPANLHFCCGGRQNG
jgi:CRISPR-associated protein Csc1